MKHMRSHEYHAIYHIKLLSGDHESAGIMNVAKDHVQSKGTYPQKTEQFTNLPHGRLWSRDKKATHRCE